MKLLLTGAFQYSDKQMNRLKSLGYEIVFIQDERVPLQINVSDINAVVCNSLFSFNDIIQFKSLKFIQLTSAGLDRVPLDYINEHEIKLFSAKGVYSIPMAEWVVLKVLEIYKKSKQFYDAQQSHNWGKHRDLLELTDKTAAIIGFGSVGSEIAKRLKIFGVNVMGIGRRKIKSPLIDEYYNIDDLDQAIKKCDIIILTLPLTEETYHLIDANIIAKMKKNSILINVSRGGVINEDELIKVLKEEKFLGVALDVFEEEPLPVESPLWDFNRVIVTPHNSFVSEKTNERLFTTLEKNLQEFINLNN
ncbi:NAD(P)-dependent oxidoreductase [Bacillus sp. UNC438CL73TsuS30]|uniref:NAD(P)-dependent oxidoreductase n=1 Tax=Bacillus sp. UNC438CL73TsuS30 TaxID=1340434 RepID=UPI00047CA998|nr:NAD(P)-dependent oxidoreductase [Bacillus sp. UNC438CL73TsuS30]